MLLQAGDELGVLPVGTQPIAFAQRDKLHMPQGAERRTYACSIVSSCWFMTSVCPSVWGCLEVDSTRQELKITTRFFQTELIHLGSLLPTMLPIP